MEIRGTTVTLINKVETGKDLLNAPTYKETETQVENVLISPVSTDDAATAQNLFGKKAVYTFGIPKATQILWKTAKSGFSGAAGAHSAS